MQLHLGSKPCTCTCSYSSRATTSLEFRVSADGFLYASTLHELAVQDKTVCSCWRSVSLSSKRNASCWITCDARCRTAAAQQAGGCSCPTQCCLLLSTHLACVSCARGGLVLCLLKKITCSTGRGPACTRSLSYIIRKHVPIPPNTPNTQHDSTRARV